MEVTSLLSSRNRCLHRFLEFTSEFLVSAGQGDFSGLESLQARRDAVIKALGLYERRISSAVEELPLEARSPELSARVEAALDEKNRLIARILETDNRLLEMVDAEKARVRGELTQMERSKALAQKFKSTWVPESGEGLDDHL